MHLLTYLGFSSGRITFKGDTIFVDEELGEIPLYFTKINNEKGGKMSNAVIEIATESAVTLTIVR